MLYARSNTAFHTLLPDVVPSPVTHFTRIYFRTIGLDFERHLILRLRRVYSSPT